MNRRLPFSRSEPGRPPGDAPGRPQARPGRVRRGVPITTRAGAALAVGLCAVAGCALLVPGLVLGAEAPVTPVDKPAAAAGRPAADPSPGTLLVTLGWGDGPGKVGVLRPIEGLARGPEALAVAPNGRIAVLDSVNKRVVFLDAGGRPEGTADIPLAEPRFLAVDDDHLYVLDCDADRRIVTIDWSGAVLDATALPELSDVVTGIFATEAGPCVEVAHDSVFLVTGGARVDGLDRSRAVSGGASLRSLAGRPLERALGRAAKATFTPKNGLRIQSFQIDRTTLNAKKTAESTPALAAGRAVEHLVSVDGDGGGGLVVGARLLDVETAVGPSAAGRDRACLLLTRFAADGRGCDAGDGLLLTESSFAYLGQPYVVAPDGRVFQPVADESGYSILVHSFTNAETPVVAEEVLP